MVSVVLLARRHLKWEEELQMNHYRFLEQNLQQTLENCRACHLEVLQKGQPNGEKDFAMHQIMRKTWNKSDSITVVIAREMKILPTKQHHLQRKSQNRKH